MSHPSTLAHWIGEALAQLSQLTACNHRNAPMHEGKVHCPDCGEGLVRRWMLVRCRQCDRRRVAGYQGRRIVPVEAQCPHCGHSQVYVQPQPEAMAQHLPFLVLGCETEADVLACASTLPRRKLADQEPVLHWHTPSDGKTASPYEQPRSRVTSPQAPTARHQVPNPFLQAATSLQPKRLPQLNGLG